MKSKLYPVFVILIALSLLVIAAGRPPYDEKKSLTEFTGTATCEGTVYKTVDKDWLDRWAWTEGECNLSTDDPATSGPMYMTLISLTHPKKANAPGWAVYFVSQRNSYADWDGWLWARITPEGRQFTKGWGWASRGVGYYNDWIWWEITDENPSVVHGWYGK